MGWQGIFGLIITALLILIVQNSGCPFEERHCTNGHIDDFYQACEQISSNAKIALLAFCFILTAAFFNGFGAMTTKYTSAASR